MNILSFLKPKHEVIFVYEDDTVEKAVELLRKQRFTSIPILSRDNDYIGTLSEGDLLYAVYNLGKKDSSKIKICDLERHRDYEAVIVTDPIVSLITRASEENFVPVLDTGKKFIGIVTRKKLLDYFFETKFVIL